MGDLSAALTRLYDQLDSGDGDVAEANEVIQGLARLLVPINYTREARFRHDPAYSGPPLPTLAVAAELTRHSEESSTGKPLGANIDGAESPPLRY